MKNFVKKSRHLVNLIKLINIHKLKFNLIFKYYFDPNSLNMCMEPGEKEQDKVNKCWVINIYNN